ncbi:hypothetical protein CsatB_016287 [Cannabis sativa]
MATHSENKASSLSSVVVVMVPFPAQSHLNQLLQLSYVVSSSYDIPVHYVSSPLHISQVKSRSSNSQDPTNKIHFHGFQIPFLTCSSSFPNSKSKFPLHLLPCFEASTHLREPVAELLRSLSPTTKRLVVIHDAVTTYVVQDVVSIQNAEAYSFNSASAFSAFAFICEILGRNDIVPNKELPSSISCFPSEVIAFLGSQIHLAMTLKFSSGLLFNSSKSIEGSFIELLSKEINGGKEKIWTIGPLHQTTISENRAEKSLVLEWLDQQEPNSVLYVSFGTTVSFSEDEIEELAFGLEQSGVKFIWVLRDADEIDVSSSSYEEGRKRPKLPDGFEERVKGMGMVVREWVPQVEILGHSSTGGFMSHCGWNSCMESLSMGVPMVAWPMHSDQPMNGLLITELLKVGVAVMEWSQREELVTSSMISRGVRALMGSEEGDEIRKRAVEIGVAVKRSVVEGGECRLEWDSFIAHITR